MHGLLRYKRQWSWILSPLEVTFVLLEYLFCFLVVKPMMPILPILCVREGSNSDQAESQQKSHHDVFYRYSIPDVSFYAFVDVSPDVL